MAVRYSGDVEIRIRYTQGVYRASLRAPGFRATGQLTVAELRRLSPLTHKSPTYSEAYDEVARILIREAKTSAKKQGMTIYIAGDARRPTIRRTFQSPCPR